MLNLLKGLWFDGELYKFHCWFHMIYILIMQLRGASFILRMKSRVLLRSEVGMIMVSICLHGVISWCQVSGRGRFGPTKTVIAEKYHPSVLKFCLTWTVCNISNKMTKFYDEPVMGCQLSSFIWACDGLSIAKALHIDIWEMVRVTAMAAGGEQTQSAHACDVSLGARIYLYSNFRGYFGSPGWWLCLIIVPSIYLLTEMVCICMLMAYLLLWLRSKYRSLDLCQGVVVQGVIGRGFRFRFTRFI